jgi:hypothetical protein
MNRFQSRLKGTHQTTWFALPIVVLAWVVILTAQAQSPLGRRFLSTPASDTVLAFPPNMTKRLTALRRENLHRVDTLKLKVKGLQPNTAFAVFLAADYLGEISTNADGRGSMRARAFIDSAFLRTRDFENKPVLRIVNPSGDDACFTPVQGLGERNALFPRDVPSSRTASVATTLITVAQSLDDDDSLFHTISWRSHKCVSTF